LKPRRKLSREERQWRSLQPPRRRISSQEDQPENIEEQNNVFKEELYEDGFPFVFNFKVTEVKMFLRVVYFYSCKIIWEKEVGTLDSLEILLGVQFLEWFENLSLSSNLFNKELLRLYNLWNSIFLEMEVNEGKLTPHFKLVLRRSFSNESQETPHLSIRHYFSEKGRMQFLNYIISTCLQRREIRRESGPRPSHFKRSSAHSTSSNRSSLGWKPRSPKVREVFPSDRSKQKEFLEDFSGIPPQERKFQLLGGIPEFLEEN